MFISGPVILVGVVLLALATFLANPVQAQDGTPPPDSGCTTCHENLYYLYDTGKWFCQCNTQMTCTCCHGGNAEALTEEEAHLGMVLYPTHNDATACQQCHPDDYEARVERFAEIAGVSQIHPMPPTSLPEAVETNAPPSDSGLEARLLEPWRLAGLIVLGLALVAIAIFGYRCWKADCLARKNK
jgi:hypothetical protein